MAINAKTRVASRSVWFGVLLALEQGGFVLISAHIVNDAPARQHQHAISRADGVRPMHDNNASQRKGRAAKPSRSAMRVSFRSVALLSDSPKRRRNWAMSVPLPW